MSKGTLKGKLIALSLMIIITFVLYLSNSPPITVMIPTSIPLFYWSIVRGNEK
jgi:hypothetical protein